MKEEFKKRLVKAALRKLQKIGSLTNPALLLHGTPRSSLESILRLGLITQKFLARARGLAKDADLLKGIVVHRNPINNPFNDYFVSLVRLGSWREVPVGGRQWKPPQDLVNYRLAGGYAGMMKSAWRLQYEVKADEVRMSDIFLSSIRISKCAI